MAADHKVPLGVVELFTSQGCSSCPPADAVFEALADRPDIIALSYHVDYWNYLGWSDSLSSAENTNRQYDYARSLRRTNVYTPQAVLNGRAHVNGADRAGIETQISAMAGGKEGLAVPVTLSTEDDCIEINIGSGSGKANVVAAYFTRERKVVIGKGENAGKTVSYRNVVTDIQTISMWQGVPLDLDLPLNMLGTKGRDGVAILVQSESPDGKIGPLLGAAMFEPVGY